jgi:hypothetical protein
MEKKAKEKNDKILQNRLNQEKKLKGIKNKSSAKEETLQQNQVNPKKLTSKKRKKMQKKNQKEFWFCWIKKAKEKNSMICVRNG